MDLSIAYEHISARMTVVTAVGEIDVYTAPKIREVLIELLGHGRDLLILDLRGVDFFDGSTGAGVLVGGWKRTRASGGGLALVFTQEFMRRSFRQSGLHKVFAIYSTVAEAEEGLTAAVLEAASDAADSGNEPGSMAK